MIVVVIIALLVAIAIPAFERARRNSHVVALMADMRNIEHGADLYFIEQSATTVSIGDIIGRNNYVKKLKYPSTFSGQTITTQTTSLTGTSGAYTASYDFTAGASAGSMSYGF